MGVQPFYRRFGHDGMSGPNIATVYSDRGHGLRPPIVFYNRANEAAAQLAPGDFDWESLFAEGVRWFHSGGIFAALSSTTGELILEAMRAAKAAGATVSFDLNYRKKLWDARGGDGAAIALMRRIVEHVDVLVGNEEDLQQALGVSGPGAQIDAAHDAPAFLEMIERLVEEYPQIKVVATTLRQVQSSNRHRWSALAWVEGQPYFAPTIDLDVLDRVGGGDGFAAGFFYGLLEGAPPESAVRLGWAHGALLATYPGDTTMATLEQVRELASGGTARVQR
jgi:2-dehydro-3-deoxygluconokinase